MRCRLCATLLTWLVTVTFCPAQDGISSLDVIRKYQLFVNHQASEDGSAWWKLAVMQQNMARYKDSARSYRRAISLLSRQRPAALADAIDDMGTMYAQQRRFSKAERLEQEALQLREKDNDRVGIGLSWMHLAMVSLGLHDLTNASTLAEMAVGRLVKERKEQSAVTPEEKMTALIYLSQVRCAQHNYAAALGYLAQAREVAVARYPPVSLPVAYIDYLLGYAHWRTGDMEIAAKQMKAGTTGMRALLSWGHPTYVEAMKQYKAFLRQSL